MTDIGDPTQPEDSAPQKALSDAARRALAEAEMRIYPELGGPKGPEPTRYGDWEQKGRAIDF